MISYGTPMELKKRPKSKVFKEFLTQLKANPPQEGLSNHSMVGSSTNEHHITFLYQPHNYRLYLDFDKTDFHHKKPSNHALQKYKSMVGIFNTAYTYTPINYDSEHKYDGFMFCQVRIKKSQVEIINKWNDAHKWRQISCDSVGEIDQRIDELLDRRKEQCIDALRCFIDLHGGKSDFRILGERYEEGIHGDEYIDKLPPGMIIHDTHFKKVYNKKLEFIKHKDQKRAGVKTFISNRTIEKISPEIADEIKLLHITMSEQLTPMIDRLSEQIELHLAVQQETLKTTKAMRQLLSVISGHSKKRRLCKQETKKKYGLSESDLYKLRNI